MKASERVSFVCMPSFCIVGLPAVWHLLVNHAPEQLLELLLDDLSRKDYEQTACAVQHHLPKHQASKTRHNPQRVKVVKLFVVSRLCSSQARYQRSSIQVQCNRIKAEACKLFLLVLVMAPSSMLIRNDVNGFFKNFSCNDIISSSCSSN